MVGLRRLIGAEIYIEALSWRMERWVGLGLEELDLLLSLMCE